MTVGITSLQTWTFDLDNGFEVEIGVVPHDLPATDPARERWDDRSIAIPHDHGSLWMTMTETCSGRFVAAATFAADAFVVRCDTIEDICAYRGRKLALAMYQIASSVFEAPVVPSDLLSIEAEAFWGGRQSIVA